MKKLMIVLAVLAVFGLATAQADTTWEGDVSADWNTAGNWDNGLPGLGSTAVFVSGAANYTIDVSANVAVRALHMQAGCPDVTINSATGKKLWLDNEWWMTQLEDITNDSTDGTLTIGVKFETVALSWDKEGVGVLNFTGTTTNSYGVNRVNGGTMLCNGVLAPQNYTYMTVASGATLGGAGSIGGAGTDGRNDIAIQSGGKLSPGAVATAGSAGTLTMLLNNSPGLDIGGAVTGDSASMLFDLVAPGTSDMVAFSTGLVTIGSGLLDLNDFAFSGTAEAGTYTLFDGYQGISGTLGSVLTGTVLGLDATLSISGDGQDVLLTLEGEPIPEPAGLGLMGVALLALRKRRS